MKKRYIILIIIFLLLMISSVVSLFIWNKYNTKNKDIVKKEEKYLIQEEDEETYHLDEKIQKDNEYTIGWLKVEGTNINYPVVQYTDNRYYLNHDFTNEYNSAGWIFMDYRNYLDDQNIVIYGHHRVDGSMFGSIDSLFNEEFYKKNNKILFITDEGTHEYEIFSVYKAKSDERYTNSNFENFQEELAKFKENSEIKLNEEEINTAQIITLSTCHQNNKDRLVVHGYRKR